MAKITNNLLDKEVIKSLEANQIVVLPTDTVYGVCALAKNEQSVDALYNLKSRQAKPGTVIANSIDQLVDLGIKRRYLTAVQQFWPGQVSIEIPNSIDYLNQKTGRQAFRIVDNAELSRLLDVTGPLVTSSCNLPGEKPADNIEQAIKYFGDKVGIYVDGGDLSSRLPSTLIRVVDDAVEVVREGSVKISDSGEIL